MTSDDRIQLRSEGAIRVITFNDPDKLNSLDIAMNVEFERILRELNDDRDARAVVITGAGRAFSAGGRLDEFQMLIDDRVQRAAVLRSQRRQIELLLGVHVPVIAAVNGPAVGQGATIASLCDIIYIAEGAYFADVHVNAGLVAGDGGGITWPKYTSLLKVKELLFTGSRVDARTAVELGMANYATAPEELMPAAMAFAERVAAMAPQAIQATKAILNQPLRVAATTALEFGLQAEYTSHDEPALRDILAANLEKARAREARG